jgi:predicted Zn-dependent protease
VAAPRLAVVPAGKLHPEEIDGAALRVAKVLRAPVEVREAVRVPRGAEDVARGQHRAALLLTLLRTAALQTAPGKLVGGETPGDKPAAKPTMWIFVTDVDLYTAKSDGVFAVLDSAKGVALVSVKRLREAFYRRPADAARQRARLVKELLRMAARVAGLRECTNPECALSASKSIPDLDQKTEAYCRPCAQRLFEGTIRV